MAELSALIPRLQAGAADSIRPVADILRLAKIAATKLSAKDALIWIDRELDGYPSVLANELPEYRKLYGTPKAWNPYRGWQSIMFAEPEVEKACSFCPVGQSVTSLEAMLKTGESSGHFTFAYPPELAAQVRKGMNWHTDVHIELGFGQVYDIVDQVRNLVLNWSLALEQAGIVGESMTFTPQEKSEAAPITHQYFIQNVGVLGNLGGQASIVNTQVAGLDLVKAADVLAAIRSSVPGLPTEIRERVLAEVDKAEAEIKSPAPDRSFLRATFDAIGSVCEGAAANLTAAGILAAIHTLITGAPAM